MRSKNNKNNLYHGKIGRNEPCPCGSEKKYKKCCMGKSNARPDKTDFTNDTQFKSMLDQLDKRVFDIIEELNNNYYQTLAEMSGEEYFQVMDNIYTDKRYEKYDFSVTEMEDIINKYGLPPRGEDDESINKTRAFGLKAAKEKYTDQDISKAIIDHYMQLIDYYDQGKYKESCVIARYSEELIEYQETKAELPLFLFKKVLDALDIHESNIMKKEEQIIETMCIDLTSLKEKDTNLTSFIKNYTLTSEQEEKAKELFEQNPDVLREQNEIIEASLKHMMKMIFAGELSGLLLEPEEIMPARDNYFELFFQKFSEEVITTMPQEQIEETTNKIMKEVVEKWRPQLLDSSRWDHIVEVIKSEIEAIEAEKQADKHQALVTTLLLLDSEDDWVKDYIGRAIILSSLRHIMKQDDLR